MRASIWLAVLLAACGKGDANKAPSNIDVGKQVAAPVPVAGVKGLDVKINGVPVVMQTALIKRIPGGERYQIYAVEHGGSCEELNTNVFNRRDEQYILFDVTPRLGADGTLATVVSDVFIQGSGEVAPGSMATVGGTAAAGSKVDVSVRYAATSGDQKHEVSGTFVAVGCADHAEADASERPKAAHPSTATITIAGHTLALTGATRTKDRILLTTDVKVCSPSTPFAQAVLRKEYGGWELGGTWFAASVKDKDREMANITITPGATGTSPDGPTVSLDLAGEGTMGGHPTLLKGTIEALDCPDT